MKSFFKIMSLALCLIGCKNTDCQNTSNALVNNAIVLPFDSLISLSYYKSNVAEEAMCDYKLIVFSDSTECSPCQLKELYHWESFDKEAKQVCSVYKTLFVFCPAKSFQEFMNKSLRGNPMRNQMYLDTSYVFRRMNPAIPDDNAFHTFLLDKDNNVIVVGNPIENEKIKELIFKKISE